MREYQRRGADHIARDLQHWLKLLVALTVCLYLIVIALVVWDIYNSSQKRHAIAQNQLKITSALCAVKSDLQQRIAGSESFLKSHPQGIPALGVSAASLRLTIEGQTATLKALAPVTCTTRRSGT
jgi:predicted negative regulator of RcsB-dependent stress response